MTEIDFLSVTVNGAELEVLKGSEGLLRSAPRHARVYAKGHALDETGEPIHRAAQQFLKELGYETTITKGEPVSLGEKLVAGPVIFTRGGHDRDNAFRRTRDSGRDCPFEYWVST